MEKAIKITNITKTFGRLRNRITAVNNLNMEIEKGTVHGFIGPNGAGKTTTIKMIIGCLLYTSPSPRD